MLHAGVPQKLLNQIFKFLQDRFLESRIITERAVFIAQI